MTTDPAAVVPGPGDRVLLDANLLLRMTNVADPQHATAVRAVSRLETGGAVCVTATQSLCEFWVVATRPTGAANGLGLSTAAAIHQLAEFEAKFPRLPDTDAVFPRWRRLVTARGVSGKPAHDARLAAAALAAGVGAVMTFNGKDFRRFAPDGLTALDPAAV